MIYPFISDVKGHPGVRRNLQRQYWRVKVVSASLVRKHRKQGRIERAWTRVGSASSVRPSGKSARCKSRSTSKLADELTYQPLN